MRVARKGMKAFPVLVALSAASILAALWVIAGAPVEAEMGIVQKIFYFHMPSAIAMYLGVGVWTIASVWYLANKSRRADAVARAGAEVATLFCSLVLTSGPIWARKAWGTYWTWDPRLTSTMLLGLLLVAYLVLRAFGEGEAERRFAAALAALSIVTVPVIHYSVQLWRGQHPTVVTGRGGGLDPGMRPALTAGFVAIGLLFTVLLWMRARQAILEAKVERLATRAVEAGVEGL